MVAGKVYRLQSRAVNALGASPFTASTAVALARLPGQASAPTKNAALSTESRLVLQWTAPAAFDSPGGDITGYRLEMDDGMGGDYVTVYDGFNAPTVTTFVVGGPGSKVQVIPGRPYRVRVAARAFNGLATVSSAATIYACTPPRELGAPRLLAIDAASNTMVLEWSQPTFNGACPLTGFVLKVDDGATGNPTTAVAGMPTDVPTLSQASVALTASDLGKTFAFQLFASNPEGSVSSSKVRFLFAVPPGAPAAGPVILSTSSKAINVQYSPQPASTGGSPITAYHLQVMAALTTGLWEDLVGHEVDTLLTSFTHTNLTKGETYFFRYRVRNAAGWGSYSPSTTAVAADAPARPTSPPSVVGTPTSTGVTLRFDLSSIDDGGSPITGFKLEMC